LIDGDSAGLAADLGYATGVVRTSGMRQVWCSQGRGDW